MEVNHKQEVKLSALHHVSSTWWSTSREKPTCRRTKKTSSKTYEMYQRCNQKQVGSNNGGLIQYLLKFLVIIFCLNKLSSPFSIRGTTLQIIFNFSIRTVPVLSTRIIRNWFTLIIKFTTFYRPFWGKLENFKEFPAFEIIWEFVPGGVYSKVELNIVLKLTPKIAFLPFTIGIIPTKTFTIGTKFSFIKNFKGIVGLPKY